jgi:hypothetical protein
MLCNYVLDGNDSVQAFKEEFLANYLEQNILEMSLVAHMHRIVNRFVTTGNVEKGKSSDHPKVIEDVVENIRDHFEKHPKTSFTKLSLKVHSKIKKPPRVALGR